MSAMSDKSQTGMFQEANRTSENGAVMYSILQVSWEPMIVKQWKHLWSCSQIFFDTIEFCDDL